MEKSKSKSNKPVKLNVTIQRHIKAGYLLASKPGKNFVITQSNLKNYLNGNF